MPGLGLGLRSNLVRPFKGDPLAGIPFALRLQTHNGNKVPMGLYKDTSGTVPATADGDPVALWKDVLGGSGASVSQSNTMKQPTLRFVNGKPRVRFDGVDDELVSSLTANGASDVYLACRTSAQNQNPIAGWRAGDGMYQFLLGSGVVEARAFIDPHYSTLSPAPTPINGEVNLSLTRRGATVTGRQAGVVYAADANFVATAFSNTGGLDVGASPYGMLSGDFVALAACVGSTPTDAQDEKILGVFADL